LNTLEVSPARGAADDISFADLKIRSAAREHGFDFFGGPDVICKRLANAIVGQLMDFPMIQTADVARRLDIKAPAGELPGEWLRAAFRRDALGIFCIVPVHKLEESLGLAAVVEYERKNVPGSNSPTGARLYEIFITSSEPARERREVILSPHEEDIWRGKLYQTPLQSVRNPLGINELIALRAFLEVKTNYAEIQARAAALLR
jgi:hypothetical protein